MISVFVISDGDRAAKEKKGSFFGHIKSYERAVDDKHH